MNILNKWYKIKMIKITNTFILVKYKCEHSLLDTFISTKFNFELMSDKIEMTNITFFFISRFDENIRIMAF